MAARSPALSSSEAATALTASTVPRSIVDGSKLTRATGLPSRTTSTAFASIGAGKPSTVDHWPRRADQYAIVSVGSATARRTTSSTSPVRGFRDQSCTRRTASNRRRLNRRSSVSWITVRAGDAIVTTTSVAITAATAEASASPDNARPAPTTTVA